MKPVLGILSLLFKLYFGLMFYLSLILLYPAFWFTTRHEKLYPACFKLKRFWSRMLQVFLLTPIRRDVKSPLPEAPFIAVSNHGSYLDIVFMYRILKQPFIFLGKKELLKWPLFKRFFKTMDIAVDRHSKINAARSLIKAKSYIDQNYSIVLFPEGTIPASAPKMIDFKDGAFSLAIEKQVPIVPIAFLNNWHLFSDADKPLGPAHPGISKIVIHEPISTTGMTMEDLIPLRNRVQNLIEESLNTHNKKVYENNG